MWGGFALACVGAAVVSGALVHSYAAAIHAAEIATIEKTHQEVLAKRATAVLNLERQAAAQAQALEDAHARMAEERAAAGADIARLSADLRAATRRLRQPAASGGGGSGLSATAAGAGGCADVRAARDALAAALERLVEGGTAIVADGARAVDVATIAAETARRQGGN